MKKMVWIGLGLVVVASVVLIGRREKIEELEGGNTAQSEVNVSDMGVTTKDTQNAKVLEAPKSTKSFDDTALSAPVKVLLGLDGEKHNYSSLLSAINDLGEAMSADDVSALMDMLDYPNDRFPEGMRPIEINAVKNDTLDKLLRQKQLPEGLGFHMVAMAGNGDHDSAWRDYCIQFMTPFYERAAEEESSTEDGSQRNAEASAVHDAMFSALEERDETLAGTALIGLELLSRTHDEFDREQIVEKTVEIASDEMASAVSRLTALRLSPGISNSEQGAPNEAVQAAARSLAQTGETVLLRSAAIVTLGEVGTETDRELLESYVMDGDRQIADAAKLALQKMDSKK